MRKLTGKLGAPSDWLAPGKQQGGRIAEKLRAIMGENGVREREEGKAGREGVREASGKRDGG